MMWAELLYSIETYPSLYRLLLVVFGVWVVALGDTVLRWLRGRAPGERRARATSARLLALLRDGLGQARTLRDPLGGIMHLLVSLGSAGILVCTVFTHYRFASGEAMDEGDIIHWLFDLFAALLLVGLLLAVYRRVTRRLPTSWEDGLLLALLFFFAVTAILGHALVTALGDLGWESNTLYARALGNPFKALPVELLTSLYGWVWAVLHTTFLGLLALVPTTKLRHLLAALASIWMRDPGPPGRLDAVDLEREGGAIGALRLHDLTRKELVDLDACTRCGRCTAACPAAQAGAPLDPMRVLVGLSGDGRQEALAETVGDAALWACTTCLACVDVCPVAAEPMRHLIDIRRERVLDAAVFPPGLSSLYRGLERRGLPWLLPDGTRSTWADGLDVPVLPPGGETDVLVWVGCMAAADPRQQQVARALVGVLRAAGMDFAMLGEDERCCGDPARRTGNEFLWQTLARENIETLQARRFRQIVALCPHGYNALKNEYPALGGTFQVVHALQLVADLVAQGRLSLAGTAPAAPLRVTYQDPCYLVRGNGLVGRADAARHVLRDLPGVELVEMEAHGRDAVCCGGGGGQMWLERPPEQRPERLRAAQVSATGASECLVACPYCAQMLGDAQVSVRDVIELVAERCAE